MKRPSRFDNTRPGLPNPGYGGDLAIPLEQMSNLQRLIVLIRLAIVTSGLLIGFRSLHLAAAVQDNVPDVSNAQAYYPNGDFVTSRAHRLDASAQRTRLVDASGPSCAYPRPDEIQACNKLEQQILASTVRLEWHRFFMMC